MPFIIASRGPSGRPSRYLDTDTGETISARQYRNRTEAQSSGFASISQKQKAQKKRIAISKTGLVQHQYRLGKPINLAQVIADLIRQYEYRDSFAVGAVYTIEEDGIPSPYTAAAQSNLYPCLPMYIRGALDELKLTLLLYMYATLKEYFVTVYPPKGDL